VRIGGRKEKEKQSKDKDIYIIKKTEALNKLHSAGNKKK
jgi:hypothetical protein